ncbi:NAD(P)/FAD-dependent oxidoreductase [Rhizobium nepotum]|uniref:NAD(P)/FAD-dependent oxidoreductase n=1 Tax=Rhizobium nepotum TaxID=1035271 RepID=UPI003CED34C5
MKTDIAIIGGGAIGSAVAYYLKMKDPTVEVTVVERDPTYNLASTPRASGGVRRLFSLPENIALSNFSILFFDNFADTMAVDGEKAEIGLTTVIFFIVPPTSRDMLKQNLDTELEIGCNVVWLEPDELKHKFPSMNVSDLGAAVHSPDDGWLDPHSVLMGFRKKARSLGALYIADEVTGFDRKGPTVTRAKLKSGETLEAEQFVNAAGAWAKDLCEMLGFKVPIEPLRRITNTTSEDQKTRSSRSPISKTQNGLRSVPREKGTREACRRFKSRVDTTSKWITTISRTSSGQHSRIVSRSI